MPSANYSRQRILHFCASASRLGCWVWTAGFRVVFWGVGFLGVNMVKYAAEAQCSHGDYVRSLRGFIQVLSGCS